MRALALSILAFTLPAAAVAQSAADLAYKRCDEAAKEQVGGGVVRDPAVWREVMERIRARAAELDLEVKGELESPVRGADGNVEFLLHLARRT